MKKEERLLILILGCLAAMGPMSIDLYLPAFPLLEREFGANAATVSNTMAGYFVGISLGQMIYGPVSDSYGRKGPLLFGLSLYTVGSLLCAFSTSINFLVAARVLQALGGCAGMVICRAVVRDLFPPNQMARVFSALLLVMGIAPILAPSVGAQIVEWQGWRPLFYTMGIFGLVCIAGTLWKIPATQPGSGSSLSLLGSFQTYANLLTHRGFLSYSVSCTFVRVGLFAYITGSPFLFQSFFHMSPKMFGLVFGVNAAGFVLASQVNSKLVERYGHRPVYQSVLAVVMLCTLPLLVIGERGTGTLAAVEASVFLFVASLGFSFPCATTGALEDQPDKAGSASALMGLMGSVAAAVTASSVGRLQTLTPMAMPLLVGLSCALAWISFRLLYRRSHLLECS